MKRLVLLLSVIVFTDIMYCQSLFDGMYSKEWERERDEINQNWTQYINQSSISGGIRFDYESSSRTSSNSNYYAQQRQRNAQRDAEHQEWHRQKEEAARLAAERERERERQREIERRRKYNEAYTGYMDATAAQAAFLHDMVDYRATVGRDFMYNYQVPGTEKIPSGYIPSNSKSNLSAADIVDEQRKSFNNQNIIKPLSDNYPIGAWNSYDKNVAQRQLHDGNNKNSYDMYETDDVKDQNLAQYMYSKYITENIMNVEDWWYRNNMSERVTNIWDRIKNVTGDFVTDPVGTLNNARESLVDDIKENITLENIAKKSVGLIPDRFENVKNIGNCEVKMVFNVFSKDGAKQTVDAVFSGNMQYVEKKQEYITRQVNNLALETAGIKNGDKITEAALLHNKPKTEQNEWLKNYLTNKATEPSNYVKREATGKIKEIVKKEIDPKGTIF